MTIKAELQSLIVRKQLAFSQHRFRIAQLLIFVTVVTRLETPELLRHARRLAPEVFIIQHVVDDKQGGMIKQRPLH